MFEKLKKLSDIRYTPLFHLPVGIGNTAESVGYLALYNVTGRNNPYLLEMAADAFYTALRNYVKQAATFIVPKIGSLLARFPPLKVFKSKTANAASAGFCGLDVLADCSNAYGPPKSISHAFQPAANYIIGASNIVEGWKRETPD